jgi:cytochrome b6-f complex iron-sulfur subunit
LPPVEHTLSDAHLWSRRGWLSLLGWGGIFTTLNIVARAFLRFMYPRVLFEPSPVFRAGKASDYLPGAISERFRASKRVWIARTTDNKLIAVFAKCTHLGCTPRWLAAENKFKCPCHGSGFRGFGPGGSEGELAVHFEGPAPRPLERLRISVDAEGFLLIDRASKFLWERDEWGKPGSYLEV